jgi:hypothetical protein
MSISHSYYLQELLLPLGTVEISKDVAGEVREIDFDLLKYYFDNHLDIG